MLYLDNNATTRPCESAVDAGARAMTLAWQNPSSLHRGGQEARAVVEEARRSVGELVGVHHTRVYFTGSGTEAIDLAIRSEVESGRLRGQLRPRVACSSVEHSAVIELLRHLHAAGEIELDVLEVTQNCVLCEDQLDRITQGTRLVCVQMANNETGVIQPAPAVERRCREVGTRFLCDTTQWLGKMPPGQVPDADYLVLSPHKFHGIKGVGVLVARDPAGLRPALIGSQETGKRGGTENVPGIAACGAACQEAASWLADPAGRARGASLRDRLERGILAGCLFARVNGGGERLWNTTNIMLRGVPGEAMLMGLSERGVSASAGSACSSGSVEASHILLAMGISEDDALSSVRFSLSRHTTQDEIDRAVEIVVRLARSLLGGSRFARESRPAYSHCMLTAGFSQYGGSDDGQDFIARPRRSGLAIAALVFGILSMVICCVPYVGAGVGGFALLLGAVAVFTIMGSQGSRRGTGMAVTGIVTGLIGAVLGIAATAGFTWFGGYLQKAGDIAPRLQDGESLSSMEMVDASLSSSATQEQVDSFVAALTAEFGDLKTPPSSVLEYLGGFGAAGKDVETAMDAVESAGYSGRAMPVVVPADNGSAVFTYVVDSGSGEITNIGAVIDGAVVWLVPPPSGSP